MPFTFEKPIIFIRNTIDGYHFFTDGNYYSSLLERYLTLEGFFLGAIAVILIYLSGAGENKKSGFFRSLAIIALLNSLGAVYNLITGDLTIQQSYNYSSNVFELAANPIAGVILTLIIYSCYKGHGKNAFCFGLITYAVSLLMFNGSVGSDLELLLIFRALTLGFACVLMIKPKYFYISFIVYIGHYLFFKVAWFFMVQGIYEIQAITVKALLPVLRLLAPDLWIFAVILIMSIVYERAVLTVEKAVVTT